MILPFAIWLALIALAPLNYGAWWVKHYFKLAVVFAAITIGYYFLALPAEARQTVIHTARDYFSFIVLIGSLYVVAGGIFISVEGIATPLCNVLFLAVAGTAANVLGTTGAAILLIRPWLKLNQPRLAARHLVFFIFIVANIGGGLTPIGDPPLLLGYLKGVPFWWVAQHCWIVWLTAMGCLLAVFFALDRRDVIPPTQPVRLRATGIWNLAFLAVIIGAVFVPEHLFLREGLMLMAASGSYLATSEKIRSANQFHFEPILEVAVLFFGIFATMMPALDWLSAHATAVSPARIFWAAGGVSSVLDNAPAYLAFVATLSGGFANLAGGSDAGLLVLTQKGSHALAALSVATVYFGAFTYIGNGPNLIVKAIAEQNGFRAPGFFAYIFKWAVPILLPLLLVLWLIFFR